MVKARAYGVTLRYGDQEYPTHFTSLYYLIYHYSFLSIELHTPNTLYLHVSQYRAQDIDRE